MFFRNNISVKFKISIRKSDFMILLFYCFIVFLGSLIVYDVYSSDVTDADVTDAIDVN